MGKKVIAFLLIILIITSCAREYTTQEISESYCKCVELSIEKKINCVKDWVIRYRGVLKNKEDCKEVNYNMIECNGFEGDNDFNMKLVNY